jgi:hypothetical protein
MTPPANKPIAARSTKGAGSVSIANLPPEQARGQFRLLLLANPNYFGNLKGSTFKPISNISSDTAYEELGCVGFSLQLSRLEATVTIKQTSGYDGGLCTAGSQEYVRFYLSFDSGATWQDQGAVSFTVYDTPGAKPLAYGVALTVSVPEDFCFVANLPQVRAILSWNFEPPPATPDFVPVWGNVVNANIQIPPRPFILLDDFLVQAKVQIPADLKAAIDLNQAVATAPPAALNAAEIAAAYKDKPVPAHRFLYSEVTKLAKNQALSATLNSKAAALQPLPSLKLDLGEIIGNLLATSGDTTYEQLECVGLDPNRSMLEGVVKVKLPYGFNGGLCTAGSTEYVAFWVDWGSGFQYAGTATINTHDISSIPADGIDYAVAVPVDLASHMQPCTSGPKTATVRAILSWQTAPPPADPTYIPVWGNSEDALVLLPAGVSFVAGTPNIAIIGGIGVEQIDTLATGMTKPGALFALTGSNADPWDNTRQCPFGGQIVIQGLPTSGSRYRLWVQDSGSPLPIALTTPIVTTDSLGTPTTQFPDPSGFFAYLDNSQNIDNILAYWESAGNDQWTVWLEIADATDTVLGSTPHYLIQLDNTAPTAAIHIDSGGDCKQFTPPTTLNGHFVAQDLHFGAFSLETLPTSTTPPPNEPTTATPSTSPTAPAPGDPWTLDTAGMEDCGYVIVLNVSDNSIVDSSPGLHNTNEAQVGFCLVSD